MAMTTLFTPDTALFTDPPKSLTVPLTPPSGPEDPKVGLALALLELPVLPEPRLRLRLRLPLMASIVYALFRDIANEALELRLRLALALPPAADTAELALVAGLRRPPTRPPPFPCPVVVLSRAIAVRKCRRTCPMMS
jgi:hypothetical protein